MNDERYSWLWKTLMLVIVTVTAWASARQTTPLMDAYRRNHQAALLTAVAHGDVPEARMLLMAGACCNDPDDPPLRAAVQADQPEMVRFLLARGADIEAVDGAHETALVRACLDHRAEILRILLEHGADPNHASVSDEPPIQLAVRAADPTMVRLLLAYGADPNAVSSIDGVPALTRAKRVQKQIADMLVEHGAVP